MTSQKWGESFLKSGLPLEHLTLIALKGIGWECELRWEYQRHNRDGILSRFELDLVAYSPDSSGGDLMLLGECKYHDESRFWFFLPCETEDHLSQYEALSADENLYADRSVLHSAPYEFLAEPEAESLLALAPKAVWGVTVSQDGTRQANAIEEATSQLAYGFVPFCLERLYSFTRPVTAVLPMIVTSARLFRIREDVKRLEQVRQASAPLDVADEVPWLWYYHAANGELLDHNMDQIDVYKGGDRFTSNKFLEQQLLSLWTSPHWIVVANFEHLPTIVERIHSEFAGLRKDFSGNEMIRERQEALRERYKDRSPDRQSKDNESEMG